MQKPGSHFEICLKQKKNFHFFYPFLGIFFNPLPSAQSIQVIGLIFFFELALKNCFTTIEIYVIFLLKITFVIQNDYQVESYLKLKMEYQKICFLNLTPKLQHLCHNQLCSFESTTIKQQFFFSIETLLKNKHALRDLKIYFNDAYCTHNMCFIK